MYCTLISYVRCRKRNPEHYNIFSILNIQAELSVRLKLPVFYLPLRGWGLSTPCSETELHLHVWQGGSRGYLYNMHNLKVGTNLDRSDYWHCKTTWILTSQHNNPPLPSSQQFNYASCLGSILEGGMIPSAGMLFPVLLWAMGAYLLPSYLDLGC